MGELIFVGGCRVCGVYCHGHSRKPAPSFAEAEALWMADTLTPLTLTEYWEYLLAQPRGWDFTCPAHAEAA